MLLTVNTKEVLLKEVNQKGGDNMAKVVMNNSGTRVQLVDCQFKPIVSAPTDLAMRVGLTPGLEFTERQFVNRLNRLTYWRGKGYSMSQAGRRVKQEFETLQD